MNLFPIKVLHIVFFSIIFSTSSYFLAQYCLIFFRVVLFNSIYSTVPMRPILFNFLIYFYQLFGLIVHFYVADFLARTFLQCFFYFAGQLFIKFVYFKNVCLVCLNILKFFIQILFKHSQYLFKSLFCGHACVRFKSTSCIENVRSSVGLFPIGITEKYQLATILW